MKKLLNLITLSTLAVFVHSFNASAEDKTPAAVNAMVETVIHTMIKDGKVADTKIISTKTLIDEASKNDPKAVHKVAAAMDKSEHHSKTATLWSFGGVAKTFGSGVKTIGSGVGGVAKKAPWGSILSAGATAFASVAGPLVNGGITLGTAALQNHFASTQANTQFNQQQQAQNTQFNQQMELLKLQQQHPQQ
jgi:hypothetical protein